MEIWKLVCTPEVLAKSLSWRQGACFKTAEKSSKFRSSSSKKEKGNTMNNVDRLDVHPRIIAALKKGKRYVNTRIRSHYVCTYPRIHLVNSHCVSVYPLRNTLRQRIKLIASFCLFVVLKATEGRKAHKRDNCVSTYPALSGIQLQSGRVFCS